MLNRVILRYRENRLLAPTSNLHQLRIRGRKTNNMARCRPLHAISRRFHACPHGGGAASKGRTDSVDKNDPLFCGFLLSTASVFGVSPVREKVSRGKPTEKYPVFITPARSAGGVWNRRRRFVPLGFRALGVTLTCRTASGTNIRRFLFRVLA